MKLFNKNARILRQAQDERNMILSKLTNTLMNINISN